MRGSMEVIDPARRQVSARQRAWLERESQQWQSEGTIDAAARAAILSRYTAESDERRGLIAVVLLAVGMCSVGLLLLIGYNWDVIPRTAKLAIVIGAVAAAFGGSALAYAREKRGVAETLAFFGTLLLGNAIWLVSQVLHIQGRYPDAFLWWALGTLACATLVRSQWIGSLAGLLLFAWIATEGELSGGPDAEFFVLWPVAIAAAYSLRSSLMVRILAPQAAFAAFFSLMDESHSAFWQGGIMLIGAALYSVGRWHRSDERMGAAWQGSGLLVLLLMSIPLMFVEIHMSIAARGADPAAVAVALCAAVVAGSAAWRAARTAADTGVLITTAAVTVWTLASWSGWFGTAAGFAMAGTVLFSILALVMAVALIRTALLSSSVTDLGAGLSFGIVFLIVRWTSVIQNMLWSGLLMVAAGAGLLLVARLWRSRQRVEAGRVS
ncbi:MAG TPA: DUF2157 domain-containing protein [Vicinamibacterales bacterium]